MSKSFLCKLLSYWDFCFSPFYPTLRQLLIQLHDSSLLQRGARHRHNNKVLPWRSEVANKRQMVIFLMPKPIPVKQVPAVPWLKTPSDVHILLGSQVSTPSLFAISQLWACLSEAFHSFSLMLPWPFEGPITLKAKNPGPKLSDFSITLLMSVSLPLLFPKEGHLDITQKSASWKLTGRLSSKSLMFLILKALFPP